MDDDESKHISREQISIEVAIDYLWKWRQYRNEGFWETMYRWGGAALVIALIPYLLPDLITKLGFAVLVFPFIALFLFVTGAWLMAAQYMLYKLANNGFRKALGEYNLQDIQATRPRDRLFTRFTIGKTLTIIFLAFGTIGQFLNGLILYFKIVS